MVAELFDDTKRPPDTSRVHDATITVALDVLLWSNPPLTTVRAPLPFSGLPPAKVRLLVMNCADAGSETAKRTAAAVMEVTAGRIWRVR